MYLKGTMTRKALFWNLLETVLSASLNWGSFARREPGHEASEDLSHEIGGAIDVQGETKMPRRNKLNMRYSE